MHNLCCLNIVVKNWRQITTFKEIAIRVFLVCSAISQKRSITAQWEQIEHPPPGFHSQLSVAELCACSAVFDV
jgi:hypothetical protein